MSVLRPVGPEPSGVYWRRRLVVLFGVLLVLIAFWLLFLRGRGASTPAPSGSASASPSTTAKPTSTSSASPTNSSARACADSDVAVSISVDPATLTEGGELTLIQGIKNVGSESCRRDIGAKANTVIITSGGYDVWTSDDCSPGGSANVVTMKPGDEYQVTVTWKGVVTAGSCPADPPAAKAGSYEAQGKNGKVVSKQKRFAINAAG